MAKIISNDVNKHLKGILDFYKKREIKLYKLLRKKGVSDREIARHLEVSRQRVSVIFKEAKNATD